ncbi:MAG: hypothetical protein KGI51_10485 [Rhodospirillales bacterium]|nr:hypothetical protein [Rhodospirillales bacterium]
MPSDPLAQPFGRVVVGDIAEAQRVAAEDRIVGERQVGPRAVGKLALQGEANKETVERRFLTGSL